MAEHPNLLPILPVVLMEVLARPPIPLPVATSSTAVSQSDKLYTKDQLNKMNNVVLNVVPSPKTPNLHDPNLD